MNGAVVPTILIFIKFFLLQTAWCYFNVHKGDCYWWSFADSYSVNEDIVKSWPSMQRVKSRSFVECCTKCDVSKGCGGVAYREQECNLLNGTAPGSFQPQSNPHKHNYKVMLYDTTQSFQSQLVPMNCVGLPCDLYNHCKNVDCSYLMSIGYTTDGVYTINPDDTVPFEAYCDMNGGGWTVFQRRQDNSTDFYRGWADYAYGFGNLTGNMWAGLDHIHAMTSKYDTELDIYMDTFEGEIAVARYSKFTVGNASSNYQLYVSGYSGTAGDGLFQHNGMNFSTFDQDNDLSNRNCAEYFKGAWWYNSCHASNLNGLYLAGNHTSHADGINWLYFKGYQYSLKSTVMKVRRKLQ